jgi:predicted small lipoprotein YifL
MISKLLIMTLFVALLWGCGKVGPLSLPEDKLDKSIITYPCDEECQKKFEEEKKRQQSVIIQTD